MIPSEHAATVAVEAAARKCHEIEVEHLRELYPPGVKYPSWDELDPLRKNQIREHVLPLVWSALEALPDGRYYAWEEGLRASFVDANAQNPYPKPV